MGMTFFEMHQGTAVRYTEKIYREEVVQNLLRQKKRNNYNYSAT